jgi:capsular polysaccharide biosynthesis protein
MTEQTLDLRRSLQVAWRRKTVIGIVAAIGLIFGAAYTALSPPALSSTVLIALPSANTNMATQSLIATSDPVLSAALRSGSLTMSLPQLRSKVKVHSPASSILSVNAHGDTAAQAENIASSVADSYITYATSSANPIGRVQARLLEPATNATGTSLPVYLVIAAGIGALAGALVGGIIALALGRRDRRLLRRDEIANSIGLPVLASVPVGHPSNVAGWTKLMENYQPEVVHAWQLRKALYDLGLADVDLTESNGGRTSLSVVSLSSDPGALALGPQLAAFAASLGIRTSLVVDSPDDSRVTGALRAACSVSLSVRSGQSPQLSVSGADKKNIDQRLDAALTIVVVVVEAPAPHVADTIRTDATVLGVSAGVITAEELARVAVSAADDGRRIAGILVADPDSADITTGRLPQLTRPPIRRMPTRLTSMTSEVRR